MRPGSVLNAASHLPIDLPGGALAPGALISIEGLRFDPSNTAVEIEVADKTLRATIIQSDSERILARMPGANLLKQTGPARLFVVSSGKRSIGSEINLAPSAFGIFTANGEAWGPAASLESPGALPIALPIAHPGNRGRPFRYRSRPRQHSRTCHPRRRPQGHGRPASTNHGVDRLAFTIPSGTPQSCSVPITVTARAGSASSNTATLPIGPGDVCASPRNWFDQIRAPGERTGNVVLLHSDVILELTPGMPVHFKLDNLLASFSRHVSEKPARLLNLTPPVGSCMTWAGALSSNQLALPSILGSTSDRANASPSPDPDALDAGPRISITGFDGTRQAARSTNLAQIYSAILGGDPPLRRIPPTPLFLSPGSYQIEIPGGADIGPAKTTLAISSFIIWINREATQTLDRRQGADLAWTLPPGDTAIVIALNINRRKSSAGLAVCLPPLGATHFHLPANSVANLPPTGASGSDLSLGFIGIAAVPVDPPVFHAQGLDRANAVFASLSGRGVTVQ